MDLEMAIAYTLLAARIDFSAWLINVMVGTQIEVLTRVLEKIRKVQADMRVHILPRSRRHI